MFIFLYLQIFGCKSETEKNQFQILDGATAHKYSVNGGTRWPSGMWIAPQKIEKTNDEDEKKPLTQAEFEEYVLKSGAKGSFMVYRSKNKEDELGIDEL